MKFVIVDDLCVIHSKNYTELRQVFGPLTYHRDSFPEFPYSKWLVDVVGVNFTRKDAERYLRSRDDVNISNVLEIKANYFIVVVDAQDVEHEYKHYEYWKDPTKANSYWNSLAQRQQEKWIKKLRGQGYNDRVIIDEVYAYTKT
jgi:hypothetical protein